MSISLDLQVLSDAREMDQRGDAMGFELGFVANARKHEDFGCVDCAGAEDDLMLCLD